MSKIEKDFLEVMSLDEIRAKVNGVHPGSYHRIMIIDGAPIELGDGQTLYITETFNVRFGIKYDSMPHVAFKDLVYWASNAAEVKKCRAIYEGLKHKEVVAKTAIRSLEKKEACIARGEALPLVEIEDEKEDKKDRDKICPAIVYCKNGSMTLTCYASFKNYIKSVKGGYEHAEEGAKRRYFVKDKDIIFEVDPEEDAKIKKALDVAVSTARAVAKKKSGGPSCVITPKVTNILHIW